MDILEFSLPRFNELPKVPLYKDQVITYLDNLSKVLNIKNTEKVLTPTMINSYVKQKIVSPPKEKKYNEKHLAYLIVVCILKQVFSIQEISTLINMQIEHCPIEVAYDYFCSELENMLFYTFGVRDEVEKVGVTNSELKGMLRGVIIAVSQMIYLERCFDAIETGKK